MFDNLSSDQDRHFNAIGQLCWISASLDRSLNRLLATVLNCDAGQVSCISTQLDNVSGRCRLLKQLIYTLPGQPWWRDDFEDVLSIIEQKLAPRRNRYIHDYWVMEDDGIFKIDRRTKAIKPDNQSPKKLSFDFKSKIPTADINFLTEVTYNAGLCLELANSDIGTYATLKTMTQESSLLAVEVQRLIHQSQQLPKVDSSDHLESHH